MANQTITRAAECDVEPGRIYEVLAQAENLPKWAPVFADSVERIDGTHFNLTKAGNTFKIEMLLEPSAHTVDYIREMGGGVRGGAFIRVIPRPLGGSTVVMTVPMGPGAKEAVQGKELEQELAALIELASA
jgi:hypothetical protein